jgi:hypothetical protein
MATYSIPDTIAAKPARRRAFDAIDFMVLSFISVVAELIYVSGRRGGGQADDLVPTQRIEKWLEAAADQAAQAAAVDLDLRDPGRPRDLSRRRRAHEGHLDPLALARGRAQADEVCR